MRGAGIYTESYVIPLASSVQPLNSTKWHFVTSHRYGWRLLPFSVLAFTKVQILETDVGKAAVNLDVAVEDTVFTVAIDRPACRAGNAPDDNTGGFMGFPAPRQIDGHVIGQGICCSASEQPRPANGSPFLSASQWMVYPQPGRTGIGLCYGVRDNSIRIKLFKTDVSRWRLVISMSTFSFHVAGSSSRKQKVLRCPSATLLGPTVMPLALPPCAPKPPPMCFPYIV